MCHKSVKSKPGLIVLRVALVLLLLFLQMSCSSENNPLDSNSGNYELTISFDALPDTLYPFRTYNVPWTNKGDDEFFRLLVSTDPTGKLDTTLLRDRKPLLIPGLFPQCVPTIFEVGPNNWTVV